MLVTEMAPFARRIMENKRYVHEKPGGGRETWPEAASRVGAFVMDAYLPELRPKLVTLMEERKFMPGGRYLYAAGRRFSQLNNCFLFRAEDSREGWADLQYKTACALMTGGGIGADYSLLREEGADIRGMGGKSTGPIALMNMTNEQGRYIIQGGSRRSAIWAGLNWKHPDIFRFIHLKDHPEDLRRAKAANPDFPLPMEGTNISVGLDDEFFAAYADPFHPLRDRAHRVYWDALFNALKTGEPGFSINVGAKVFSTLRNACTEVDSEDDKDMCNLGSLSMGRFRTLDEFRSAVYHGTAFLLCGTLASKLPMDSMYAVREKNRRLGLGLMGVHEWLLLRGKRYGPDAELAQWMAAYAESTAHAHFLADRLGVSRPAATRAVAPTGTISIVAETSSGIEPIFATAIKRRYLDGKNWKYQYYVDPTAQRLIDGGVDPDMIEDSLTLAEDVGRRIEFQAWMQKYVDHGISSTINLPKWGSTLNNEGTVKAFGDRLMKHLPDMRGVTMYPDGARDGQPLTRVSWHEAHPHVGREYDEVLDGSCRSGVCSS